jgi:hypothetical protein
MQLSGETCASKRKQKKAKRLSFSFLHFCESLFLNELSEKNKKSAFALTRAAGCAQRSQAPHSLLALTAGAALPRSGEHKSLYLRILL